MRIIGIVSIGKDAELLYSPSGAQICFFSAAWDYGKKEDKHAQWCSFTLFGKRGEALVTHLRKGARIFVDAGEVHIRTWEKKEGGTGMMLSAVVDALEFVGEKKGGAAPQEKAKESSNAPPKTGGFEEFEDDIPF